MTDIFEIFFSNELLKDIFLLIIGGIIIKIIYDILKKPVIDIDIEKMEFIGLLDKTNDLSCMVLRLYVTNKKRWYGFNTVAKDCMPWVIHRERKDTLSWIGGRDNNHYIDININDFQKINFFTMSIGDIESDDVNGASDNYFGLAGSNDIFPLRGPLILPFICNLKVTTSNGKDCEIEIIIDTVLNILSCVFVKIIFKKYKILTLFSGKLKIHYFKKINEKTFTLPKKKDDVNYSYLES